MNTAGFLARIDRSDPTGCHPWTGGKGARGRGNVRYEGKYWIPARLAWTLAHGPIPDGLDVLHACDNPPCCNTIHLSLGTHMENMQDAVAKGRQSRGQRASSTRRRKLTETNVRDMRRAHAKGASQQELATLYGVSRPTVSQIVRGVRWRHVTKEDENGR